MPGDKLRYYWDSCVLLALINGEAGRVDHIRALMEDAERGEFEILTSTLTITEVAYAAQDKAAGALTSQNQAAIDKLWHVSSPIKRVDFHAGIAMRARDLVSTAAIQRASSRLAPPDAIHLATAESLGADALHTYNLQDFQPWAIAIGLPVAEPIKEYLQGRFETSATERPSGQSPNAAPE